MVADSSKGASGTAGESTPESVWRELRATEQLTLDIPVAGPGESASERDSYRLSHPLSPATAHALRDLERRAGAPAGGAWPVLLAELLRRHSGQDTFLIPWHSAAGLIPVRIAFADPLEPERLLAAAYGAGYDTAAAPSPAWLRRLFDADEDGRLLQAGISTTPVTDAEDSRSWGFLVDVGDDTVHLAYASDGMLGHRDAGTLLARLIRLAEQVSEQPDAPLDAHNLLTDEDSDLLLGAWGGRASAYPRERSVADLFAEVAARDADRTALEWEDGTLSYGELDQRTNQLAHHLAGLDPMAPGDRIGVCLERSPEQIIAILGILRAGCCYVPLDPTYPPERLQFMVENAGIKAVVTASTTAAALPETVTDGLRLVEMDTLADTLAACPTHAPEAEPAPKTMAYIMYTSGSTGTPKGVAVRQRGIVRLVREVDWIRFGPDTRMLGFSPVSFDASTLELYGPLLNGGTLVIAPPANTSLYDLARFMESRSINTAWLTAALFHEMVEHHVQRLRGLRYLLAGGDVLSTAHVRKALEALPDTTVINGYGPTENTTFTTVYPMTSPEDVGDRVAIGRPITNTRVYLLDSRGRLVPPGMIGELHAGGDGVAEGYVERPDLTAERFVPDPFSDTPGATMYRTGDLARFRPDGALEFLGRMDQQVKISGYRIEPGEIETAIRDHPAVADAVVIVVTGGQIKRLIAYVVGRESAPDPDGIRAFLAERLPRYMLPARIVPLDALPVTPNGKVDRARLPNPDEATQAPASGQNGGVSVPATDYQQGLLDIWRDLLGVGSVGLDEAFFDVGGNSLLALSLVERIAQRFDRRLSVVRVFEHPTIRRLAAHLADEGGGGVAPRPRQARTSRRTSGGGVAIVGMAGRFPGARTVTDLWSALCEGRETVRFFSLDEIDPAVPLEVRNDPDYVPARGIVDDYDRFDARFFGISPRLAQVMDPQQRLFLETAWEALEASGHVPEHMDGPVGVFAGTGFNSYFMRNLHTHPDILRSFGDLPLQMVNEKDYVPMLVAHRLNLTGPAVSVHTACSTSLVAVIQACRSLLAGDCDMALAGGSAITCPVHSGHVYEEGTMASRDGHTRTFDADATGTVFSDGVAAVVLRRLEDAEADGDHIHAVIRGTGISNDGANRASFSAPSVHGQAAAISMALQEADWSADTVGYVENHGTATPLGDPIEVEALTQTYRRTTDRNGYCGLGSIKSNLGHLTAAAGVAGLIKTTLAVERGQIPPSINHRAPNPKIDFGRSPFFVNTELRAWKPGDTPRRAGVSAFGFGGTNAHVVIEQYTPPVPADAAQAPRSCLLPVSAATETALEAQAERLAAHLERSPDEPLGPVGYTLQTGRRALPHRGFVVADGTGDAVTGLRGKLARGAKPVGPDAPPVAFLFPGQGVQYPGMGAGLYADEPVFRQAVDRCLEILEGEGVRLRHLLLPGADADRDAAAEELRQTALAQPAIVTVEYALACVWQALGVRPAAMLGHSVGEFTAACVGGLLSLENTLKAVAARGRLMQSMAPGAMLSVRASEEDVRALLPEGLDVAAINAPKLVAVAGPAERIQAFQESLGERGLSSSVLVTSHAFHSSMMDDAMSPFEDVMAELTFRQPTVPILSSMTGDWLGAEEGASPAYWSRQIRSPVLFSQGVRTIQDAFEPVFLDVGPMPTATALARQTLGGQSAVVSTAGTPGETPETEAMLAAVGRLWTHGVSIDWPMITPPADRRRVPLPTYPFEGERHWIDPRPADSPVAPVRDTVDRSTAGASTLERVISDQLGIIERQLSALRASRKKNAG